MTIKDYGFETPIKVLAKYRTRVKQAVTAKEQTIVPAYSVMAVLINVHMRDHFQGQGPYVPARI